MGRIDCLQELLPALDISFEWIFVVHSIPTHPVVKHDVDVQIERLV
jgi:hypothetical protein